MSQQAIHLYKVLYKFDAQSEIELSCQVGDILVSDAKPHDNWLMVAKYFDMNGQKGFVPVSFIERMTPQQEDKFFSSQEGKDKKKEQSTSEKDSVSHLKNHARQNSNLTTPKSSKLEQQRREKKTKAKELSNRMIQGSNSESANARTQINRVNRLRTRTEGSHTTQRSTTNGDLDTKHDLSRLPSENPSHSEDTGAANAPGEIYSNTNNITNNDSRGIFSQDRRNRISNEQSGLGIEPLPATKAAPRSIHSKPFSMDLSRPQASSSIQQIFEIHANERHSLFDEYNEELHKTTDLIQLCSKETHDLIQRIRQLETQITLEQNNLKAHH